MEKLTVEATVPEKKNDKGEVIQPKVGPFQISVNTGATAAEMIQMFGDKAVKNNADANWVVTLQSTMRSWMKKGKTQEQIQAELGGAKLGVTTKGSAISPEQAYIAMFAAATPEKQAEMLKELKAKAAGLGK